MSRHKNYCGGKAALIKLHAEETAGYEEKVSSDKDLIKDKNQQISENWRIIEVLSSSLANMSEKKMGTMNISNINLSANTLSSVVNNIETTPGILASDDPKLSGTAEEI